MGLYGKVGALVSFFGDNGCIYVFPGGGLQKSKDI